MLGKSLMHLVFQPPLSCRRMGVGPGTLPTRGSPHSPCRAYALCGNVFSCFMFSEYSFVLLKCVHQWPSVKPPAFSLSNSLGEGLWHERGAHKPSALCWLLGGPTGHEGPLSMIGAELALTVLHVSKALFHSVLEYVVFF